MPQTLFGPPSTLLGKTLLLACQQTSPRSDRTERVVPSDLTKPPRWLSRPPPIHPVNGRSRISLQRRFPALVHHRLKCRNPGRANERVPPFAGYRHSGCEQPVQLKTSAPPSGEPSSRRPFLRRLG